ncbi:MAG: restriction endonuclease, partial [Candidatus Woesearchaeota archaeon]
MKSNSKYFNIVFLIFILSSSIVFAETEVTNRKFLYQDKINIDNTEFKFNYAISAEKLLVDSIYGKEILGLNDCDTIDIYKFCLTSVELGDPDYISNNMFDQVRITLHITKYNSEDKPRLDYEKPIGYFCQNSSECFSKMCLNNICTTRKPICGDGYCDDKERCENDCELNAGVISINPYKVRINVSKDWQNPNFILQPETIYSINSEGEFDVDTDNKDISQEGVSGSSQLKKCTNGNYGSLVAEICGFCVPIGTKTTIQIDQECKLFLGINDLVLLDNSGYVDVTIEEKYTKEDIENVLSVNNRHFEFRNSNDFKSLSSITTGQIKTNFMEFGKLDREIRKYEPSTYFYLTNYSILNTTYKLSDDTFVVNNKVKNGNETYNVTIFITKKSDQFLITEIRYKEHKFSSFDMNSEKSNINSYLQKYYDQEQPKTDTKTTNTPSSSKEKDNAIPFLFFLIIGGVLLSRMNIVKKEDGRIGFWRMSLGIFLLLILLTILEGIINYVTLVLFIIIIGLVWFVKKQNEESEGKKEELEKEMKNIDSEYQDVKKKRDSVNDRINKTQDKLKKLEKEKQRLKEEQEVAENLEQETLNAELEKIEAEKKKLNELKRKQEEEKKRLANEKKELDIEKAKVKSEEKEIETTKKDISKQKKYNEFKTLFDKNTKKYSTWAQHIEIFANEYKNEFPEEFLVKFIQQKYNVSNEQFVKTEVKTRLAQVNSDVKISIISDMAEIDNLSGQEFEEYLEEMFTNLGYESKKTQSSRDGGVDLVLVKDNKTTLVQAKRYQITGRVGVSAIRDINTAKIRHKADNAVVLATTMNFTYDAK